MYIYKFITYVVLGSGRGEATGLPTRLGVTLDLGSFLGAHAKFSNFKVLGDPRYHHIQEKLTLGESTTRS